MSKPIIVILLVILPSVMQSASAARPVAGKDYHQCVLINVEKACTFEAIETIKASCAAIHSYNEGVVSRAPSPDRAKGDIILASHIGYDGDALEMHLKNTSDTQTVSQMTIVFLQDSSRTNTGTFIRTIGPRPYGSQAASFTLAETLRPGEERVFFLDASNLNRTQAYNWQIIDVVSSTQ